MSPSLPVVVPFLIFTGNKIIMIMMMMIIMTIMIIIIIITIIIIIVIIIAGKHITAKMTNPALALYKYKTNVQ